MPSCLARARRDDPLRRSSLVASCFFLYYFGFCTAAPTYTDCQASIAKFHKATYSEPALPASIRLLAQHVSSHSVKEAHRQRNSVKKKKEMASSADLEIQCLADAAAYIERHGWPRSRLEGWRCAPVPRVSNPAHWDPYWISPHDEVARSPKYVLALVADFVQCKACAALRRLPGPLSGKAAPDSLADDWHCTQNTWDPAVAYCNAAEEDKGAEIKPMNARIRAVLAGLPLTVAEELDARAIHEQVERAIGAAIRDLDRQGLLPAAQGAEVGDGPVQPRQPEKAGHHTGGLSQGQLEENFDRQAKLDSGV